MRGNYDLQIQNRHGEWKHADLEDTDIALNFEVNDIAELKTLKSNWSQEIRLPVTNNNALVFDLIEVPQSGSPIPYTKMPCRLYCDGMRIAGKGAYIRIMGVKKGYYSCQILYGNKDFFNELKNRLMSDLNLGVFQVTNSSLNIDNWNDTAKFPDPETCVMCAATFIAQNTWPEGVQSIFLTGAGGNWPFVRIAKIIEKIISGAGYKFDDSSVRDLYVKDALSLADTSAGEMSDALNIEYISTDWVYNEFIGYFEMSFSAAGTLDGTAASVYSQQFSSVLITDGYKAIIPHRVNVHLSLIQYSSLANTVVVLFYDEGDERKQIVFNASDLVGQGKDIPLDLNPDNVIFVVPQNFNAQGNPPSGFVFSWKITVLEAKPAVIGTEFNISERLGFNTQLDFIDFLAKTYGLIFNVDDAAQKVIVFNLKLPYDNRLTAAKVWDDKLNDGSEEVTFCLNSYAQKNYLRMEDNDADSVTDATAVVVDNTTLEAEKDMFSLPVQAGKNIASGVQFLTYNIKIILANVPLFEFPVGDENSGKTPYELLQTAKASKIKPHLVRMDVNVNVLLYDNPRTFGKLMIVRHRTTETLVADCYGSLQKMLNKAKIIEAEFRLYPQDVQNFDHTVPIYLRKYGRHFYVNKIQNFRAGYMTRCTLIKL